MHDTFPLRLAGIVASLLVAACASHPPAPVVDLSSGNAKTQPQVADGPARYLVQAGDSLYTIAFRHDLDWRKLARWNGIAAPYTIYPGMQLRLDRPARMPAPSPQPLAVQTVTVERAPVSVLPTSEPPVSTVESAATPVVPPAPDKAASEPVVVSAPVRVNNAAGVAWSWPSQSPVITTFKAGDPTRHGIDIGGNTGDPVLATADGVVVYSGNGLVGYGELVIIKHSDAFLSAYGHNSKRLVQEGQHVSRGERIAEMGSTGSTRTELHFEIRREGEPVDPMAFLPSR